ncbi:probable N-acetyl-gamma-glutamyl-phosphate reductase, chloroplastic [Durio zibethinus]|uniref:Probable N-acetyl-gamma-glutamyl-phosphate reductase, chloroplastic n=1 Tax=Durio zibethinus TaxID=66656 RepID=A0A6P5Y9N6_DURZI|nr:probable N-acetyl-gamma-glutamyl-phosphate reductase, chloroplastic [Durio zibethinus]XP_022737200.1 probable N-acetyl-gamma-glutamyl-phosphate reductase, chloroplastic [Durio zibethinus]XP_022737201.1 probable N-acetyl-gamma-glutamyl-phosphate reductase, chloroplastic [Durio zibethinus]
MRQEIKIVWLLANYPYFGITLMTTDRKAGQSMGSVFPHLITQDLPTMVSIKGAEFSNMDAVFCCLPHGTAQCPELSLQDSLSSLL